MSVHSLLSAHPEQPRSGVSRDETYNLWHVAALVGCKRFGKDRLVSYLTALIADHDFPKPLPAPVKKRAVAAVHPESQWRRVAVDHWLDGFLPPDCSAALDERALAAAANDMDAQAAQLGRPLIPSMSRDANLRAVG